MNILVYLATLPVGTINILIILAALAGFTWIYSGLKKSGLLADFMNLEIFNRVKPEAASPRDDWRYWEKDLTKPMLKTGPGVSSGPKPYLIEIVIITEGKNIHLVKRSEHLDFIQTFDGINYEVSTGNLYAKNPDLLESLIMRIQHIESKYLIIFWEGMPGAITIPSGKVNPQVLARVRTSRVLGRALKEMFRASLLNNKGLIFMFIVFGVAAIIVLKMVGYL